MTIVAHIENGSLQRVSSDDPDLMHSHVVVVEDQIPDRILKVEHSPLDEHIIRMAQDRTACEGMSIACDLAAEQLLRLSKTRYTSTHALVGDVQKILLDLVELIDRSKTRPNE